MKSTDIYVNIIDYDSIIRAGFKSILKNKFNNIDINESENIPTYSETKNDNVSTVYILVVKNTPILEVEEKINSCKELNPNSVIILCDEIKNLQNISTYIKLGVNGFISPKTNANHLIKCFRHVLEGKRYLDDDFQETIISDLFENKWNNQNLKNKFHSLTDKEKEIAKLLIEGYKISWIANKLGKQNSTVSTVKRKIFQKLKVENIIKLRDAIEDEIK